MRPENAGEPQAMFGRSFKRYSNSINDPASRTGINLQYTLTRRLNEPTISIELAPIVGPRQPPTWSEKITVQLEEEELVMFVSVTLGLRANYQAAYHGDGNNKNVAAYDNRSKGVVITVGQGGRQLKHAVRPESRPSLAAFSVTRLASLWQISATDTIALLRQMAAIEMEQ